MKQALSTSLGSLASRRRDARASSDEGVGVPTLDFSARKGRWRGTRALPPGVSKIRPGGVPRTSPRGSGSW
eukprot:1434370-Alexandrium_andersonii.AAC.1